MRFAELDAVTVDGYGTLLVLDDPVARLREALAARTVHREHDDVAAAFAAEVRHYRPRAHLGRDAASLASLRLECVAIFLGALGDPLPPAAFVGDFLEALSFSPVTGAVETLELLRERGLSLAVVANWDCALPEHLGRLGLDRFFSAVVTSASAGAVKPDPAIFRVALGHLGVEPERALHVGDEAVDEDGARAARMRFAPAPLTEAFKGLVVSGRLVAWLVLVGAQIVLAYGGRISEGKPDRNAVYHYSLAVGGFIQYAIILGIVLWIAQPGIGRTLALRRPRSWGRALGLSLVLLVGIYILAAVLDPFLHPGEEQGLTPTGWDSSRAGAFAANFIVITIIGPFVEEAEFRGLGYSLLAPYGSIVAIVAIGLTFGLVHGLVEALPILAAFGAGLAYLRARTESLYPCVLVHATFNAIALIISVTT